MHQSEKHPECRGLARPVRAQESSDRSVHHIETEIIYGCNVAESLGQSANGDCGHLMSLRRSRRTLQLDTRKRHSQCRQATERTWRQTEPVRFSDCGMTLTASGVDETSLICKNDQL